METTLVYRQRRFAEDLSQAGLDWLLMGIERFYRYREQFQSPREPIVGALASSLECLIKSYLALKNIGLVVTDASIDTRIRLTCPESIPSFLSWRESRLALRSATNRTITFAECVDGFYVFFPHLKQLYLPHLRFLSTWAPVCHHGVLPAFGRYDMDRIAYAALEIAMVVQDDPNFDCFNYTPTDEDRGFIAEFLAGRVERVEATLANAKTKTSLPSARGYEAQPGNWTDYAAVCPVCRKPGRHSGYTALAEPEDEEGKYATLDYFAVDFTCPVCGLILNDVEELKIAGMSTILDRSPEMDLWFGAGTNTPDDYTD